MVFIGSDLDCFVYQAATFDWKKKASAAAFVGASVAPQKKTSLVQRQALDQSPVASGSYR